MTVPKTDDRRGGLDRPIGRRRELFQGRFLTAPTSRQRRPARQQNGYYYNRFRQTNPPEKKNV